MVQVYNGHYGHHLVYLTGEQFKLVAQLNVALNVIDPAAVFFARASICAFLFRMIGDIRKWALGIGLAMLLNAVVFIGTSIIFGVQCVPLRHRYDPLSPGKCINLVYFDNVVRVFSGKCSSQATSSIFLSTLTQLFTTSPELCSRLYMRTRTVLCATTYSN